MIHAIGRWAYTAAKPFIAYLVSRERPRVRVEIRNNKKQVLLVKSWFSSQKWELPGGGINKGEAPSRAAVREVYEETTLVIDRKRLSYLTTLPAAYPLRCDLVIYNVMIKKMELKPLSGIYKFEIIDRKWYDIDQLPENIGRVSEAIIKREFEETS